MNEPVPASKVTPKDMHKINMFQVQKQYKQVLPFLGYTSFYMSFSPKADASLGWMCFHDYMA